MHLVLDTRDALAGRITEIQPSSIRQYGRKFVGERQLFIAQLVQGSYERRFPHALYHDCEAFGREFLRRGLRADRQACTPLLRAFFLFEEGNRGYCRDRGLTKAYRIRPHILAGVDAVHRNPSPLPVMWSDDAGNHTPFVAPVSGIPERCAVGFSVPAVLKLSETVVEAAVTRAEGGVKADPTMPLHNAKPDGLTVTDALQQLRSYKKWTQALGGIPNLYEQQESGRLGPNGTHIINMPSVLRRLIFQESTLHDYDIRSCFWSILQSLARAFSVRTPVIDDYINDRAIWHHRWSKVTGRPGDRFKILTTSWLCGATLSAASQTTGVRLLGCEGLRQLQLDSNATSLYREITTSLKRLIGDAEWIQSDGSDSIAVNAVGQALVLRRDRSDFGRTCSHMLTGLEQFAIRTMCRQAAGVVAVIYDGFIAPTQPTEALERAVRDASQIHLGYSLNVGLKAQALSAQIEDPSRAPWDF
jgi:hypothetical protein